MTIAAQDLQGMVSHWLGCPPNGYLGSDYGSGVEDLLHTPLESGAADALVAKLRTDIRIMGELPESDLEVLAASSPPDRLTLFFQVAGALVALPSDVSAGS